MAGGSLSRSMRNLISRVWVVAMFLLVSRAALGHQVEAAGPRDFSELLRAWSFEPGVVIPICLSAFLFIVGVVRLRSVSAASFRNSEVGFFAAGWVGLVIALISPLHAWGAMLFSAHMTQHEILMLIAAPLLVLGRPLIPFLWAFPKNTARRLGSLSKTGWWNSFWRSISNPLSAWLIHAAVLWGWHFPALFQATLESEAVHALQHASFLLSALLFWWAVIHGRQRALGFGLAVLYMFTTAMHSGLLGALLTFAKAVWYPAYSDRTAAWGLTPSEDQQIGGLIMW